MVRERGFELTPQVRARFLCPAWQILFKHDVEVGQCRRARHGMSAEGQTVQEARTAVESIRYGLSHQYCAERRIRRSDAFGSRDEIWLNAEIRRAEQLTEPAEAADHFIHDHQDAGPVAELADPLEVIY